MPKGKLRITKPTCRAVLGTDHAGQGTNPRSRRTDDESRHARITVFGLRELEYAPAPLDPGFIVPHAYSISEYLLSSGKRLADGETIGVTGQPAFAISHRDAGDVVSTPLPASACSKPAREGIRAVVYSFDPSIPKRVTNYDT
jgi:hypothetical protein